MYIDAFFYNMLFMLVTGVPTKKAQIKNLILGKIGRNGLLY